MGAISIPINNRLIEIDNGGGAYTATGSVASFSVAIPANMQAFNWFEGEILALVNSSALTFYDMLPNGLTTNSSGTVGGAGFGGATPFNVGRNSAGFTLGATSTDGTLTTAWSRFTISRIGSVWTCQSRFGASSATVVHRSIYADSAWFSGANLTSLTFAKDVDNFLTGTKVKLRGRSY